MVHFVCSSNLPVAEHYGVSQLTNDWLRPNFVRGNVSFARFAPVRSMRSIGKFGLQAGIRCAAEERLFVALSGLPCPNQLMSAYRGEADVDVRKSGPVSRLVRTAGLEPARSFLLGILSPVCLPVPPRPHVRNLILDCSKAFYPPGHFQQSISR